jgi:hypothetical protein
MRVTFFRLPERQRGWALIERDDGVAYRIDGPSAGKLPHDLVHFSVERSLGLSDGIWGAVAAGVVFHSMRHESGRRPPHAAERSAALLRVNRARIQRAELLGGLAERIADLPAPTPDVISRLAREHLATLPAEDLDLAALATAATAVREATGRWHGLAVGDRLSLDWPRRLRMEAVPPDQDTRRAGRPRPGPGPAA